MILKKPLFSTFILLLFILIDPSFTQSESELEFNFNQGTLPEEVVIEMAKRESRYHHFIWHNVRDNWNKLSPRGQQQIRDLGWAPPNPARQVSNGYSVVILDNLSGEDFLYMHRQMINKVNDILNQSGGSYGSNITGWTTIPAPGDRDWPVPDRYTIPGDENKTRYVTQWKTTSFYNTNIKPNEDIFTNPRQLRRMTLAELGARIDATVHGYMHLRFSGRSEYGYRPQTTSLLPDIDEQWDDPEYNWLVDVYSSAVNPTFWKLHGWIDDRIEDWRRANGLSNITWNGTWTGGPMEEIDFLWDRKEGPMMVGEAGDGDDDIMKKVGRIFAEEGLETSFADPVFVEVPKILLKSKAKRRLCNIKPKRKSSR